MVQSFYCGGSLHKWLPGDDPWKEHAKSYPDCSFPNLMKTPEYVIRVNGLSHSIFQYSYLSSTNNIDPVKDEYVFNVNNELDTKKARTKITDNLFKLLSWKSPQLLQENRRLKE